MKSLIRMWLITSLDWGHYLIPTIDLKKKKKKKISQGKGDFPEVIRVSVFSCGYYLSYSVQSKSSL